MTEQAQAKALTAAIARLKDDIQTFVTSKVIDFEQDTGVTPSAIDIHMIDVTAYRDSMRRSIVGSVRITIGGL